MSLAITYIGYVASYGWCKHECDAVRRCMGFAFHGTRSTHGHCSLLKSATKLIDSEFYDVYVKTKCVIDERIQSNSAQHGQLTDNGVQTVRFQMATTPEPPAPTVCVPLTDSPGMIYCY